MGRASIEAVLQLSPGRWPEHPSKQGAPSGDRLARDSAGPSVSEGAQTAGEKAPLAEERRGRTKRVAVPAYEGATGHRDRRAHVGDPVERRFTRRYSRVISEMADTVGVSRSTVPGKHRSFRSRATAVAGRRFDDIELLIIYIDGMHFGINACWPRGCGYSGRKHVLGLA